MKKKTAQSGNTREQLVIPGLEAILSSAALGDSPKALGKYTYEETWGLTKQL